MRVSANLQSVMTDERQITAKSGVWWDVAVNDHTGESTPAAVAPTPPLLTTASTFPVDAHNMHCLFVCVFGNFFFSVTVSIALWQDEGRCTLRQRRNTTGPKRGKTAVD